MECEYCHNYCEKIEYKESNIGTVKDIICARCGALKERQIWKREFF